MEEHVNAGRHRAGCFDLLVRVTLVVTVIIVVVLR